MPHTKYYLQLKIVAIGSRSRSLRWLLSKVAKKRCSTFKSHCLRKVLQFLHNHSKIISADHYVALFLKYDLVSKLHDVIVNLLNILRSSLRPLAAVSVENKELQITSLNKEKAGEQIISAPFFLALIFFELFEVKVLMSKNVDFKIIFAELHIAL